MTLNDSVEAFCLTHGIDRDSVEVLLELEREESRKAIATVDQLTTFAIDEWVRECDRSKADLAVRTGQLNGSREHVEELHRKVTSYATDIRNLLDERDKYRAHSVTLNTIGWKIAVVLGDVPEGADAVVSDPESRTDRLIALYQDQLRRIYSMQHQRGLILAQLHADDAKDTIGCGYTRTETIREILGSDTSPAIGVIEAAKAVVTVWRQWESSRGKEVIPIKALAAAVDVLALTPAANALRAANPSLGHPVKTEALGQALTHRQPQDELDANEPTVRIVCWSVREHLDIDEITTALAEVSGGTIHAHNVNTEADEYAIAFSDRLLSDEEAFDAYLNRWDDEDDDEDDDEAVQGG